MTADSGFTYGKGGYSSPMSYYLPILGSGLATTTPSNAVPLPTACTGTNFTADFVATYEFGLSFVANPPQTSIALNVSSVPGQPGSAINLCTLQLNNQGHLACSVPGTFSVPAGFTTFVISLNGGFYISSADLKTSLVCQ